MRTLKNQILLMAKASLAIALTDVAQAADSPSKPNFLFILIDDLGWPDLGCYGSDFYETPRIDALAASGVRFTNAYSASPVCSPTRAAIMTGQYPSRVDITDWIPGAVAKNPKLIAPEDRDNLDLKETTMAEAFKRKGYETFYAGKWHLGDEGHFPEDQGFDFNKGGHHKGSPPGGYYAPFNNPRLEDKPDDRYLTDRLADESIEFLDYRDASKPFLLYLSFYTVHTPIQGADKYDAYFTEKAKTLTGSADPIVERDGKTRSRQNDPKYAAMAKSMDENIGRILDALHAKGLDDNTVIIFTSDNGGLATKAAPGPTSVLPLRAGKGWCYEGGIRVPLIIRAPGVSKAGLISHIPAISMDYFPTMLELAGFKLMPKLHKDGVSLVNPIQGKTVERDTLYWHYPHYHGSMWTPGAAIRVGNWKAVQFYHYGEAELYNLSNDIGEQNNLAKSHPEKLEELLAKLASIQKKTLARIPTPNPTYNGN
ncbi:MAG: arylsulfatase [Verrucomicrobia bacterium TMED71]|nr:MAG: arylsulfatase [Verrucomicrobia bacterium TMED71]